MLEYFCGSLRFSCRYEGRERDRGGGIDVRSWTCMLLKLHWCWEGGGSLPIVGERGVVVAKSM